METLNRINRKTKLIDTLEQAQRLAFAPLSFQALNSIIELGILEFLDKNPSNIEDIKNKFTYNEYVIKTLFEVGLYIGVIDCNNSIYSTTKLGQMFLYDDMTKVNFNFIKDVCYIGANKLTESFITAKPQGLKDMFPNADTIYPYLTDLPEKMQKSWYEFDHYYSNNCFDLIYKIIFKNSNGPIYDIGGNTGLFEKLCLKNNPSIDITMIDLEKNINYIKNDSELKNCKFIKADILSTENNLPKMTGSVLMSQFLDCFSAKQIKFILDKIYKCSSDDIKIYILEPFFDNQKFRAASFSLVHTSLYFTSMANGCSKMYSKADLEKIIISSNFKINETYNSIGVHDYTLLECIKNA